MHSSTFYGRAPHIFIFNAFTPNHHANYDREKRISCCLSAIRHSRHIDNDDDGDDDDSGDGGDGYDDCMVIDEMHAQHTAQPYVQWTSICVHTEMPMTERNEPTFQFLFYRAFGAAVFFIFRLLHKLWIYEWKKNCGANC